MWYKSVAGINPYERFMVTQHFFQSVRQIFFFIRTVVFWLMFSRSVFLQQCVEAIWKIRGAAVSSARQKGAAARSACSLNSFFKQKCHFDKFRGEAREMICAFLGSHGKEGVVGVHLTPSRTWRDDEAAFFLWEWWCVHSMCSWTFLHLRPGVNGIRKTNEIPQSWSFRWSHVCARCVCVRFRGKKAGIMTDSGNHEWLQASSHIWLWLIGLVFCCLFAGQPDREADHRTAQHHMGRSVSSPPPPPPS